MKDWTNTSSGMVLLSTVYVLRNLQEVFGAESRPVSYDMLFRDRNDGCARHDDVWGG